MYNREEVYENTLEYFQGDSLASNVWIDKYALKNKNGDILEKTPDCMHKRLAKEFARIESNYKNPLKENEIYNLLKDFKYIVPQGSPMAGIGNDFQITSISNCFYVEHKGDSYNSISDVDHKLISVFKRRGGCGVDISTLRPQGSFVNNAALSSTGSVSFAERYSNTAREVGAEGRRAALMISMSVKHPDIGQFIDSKLEKGKIIGANISVKLSNHFMKSVNLDSDFVQTFPIDLNENDECLIGFYESYENLEYNKLYPLGGNCYAKKIKAKYLWNKITYNAWKSAEPGVLFWDKFKEESTSEGYEGFELQGVNPCSELSLSDSESCRLLSLNLYSYVNNPFTKERNFDFELFKSHSIIAQRLLDDMVDLEIEKVDKIINKIKNDPELDSIKQKEIDLWVEINRKSKEGRRTGLGITAEGDMLAALGLCYGSKESIEFSEKIHEVMAVKSYTSSIIMAEERGSFPIWNYEKERNNSFINRIIESDQFDLITMVKLEAYGRRNIANLTIAPTGTTSLMTQTTSGIEPVFLPIYNRRRKVEDKNLATFIDENGDMWEEYNVFHHKFIEWFIRWNELDLNYQEGFNTLQLKTQQELDIIIQSSPYYKATSADVDYLGKVELQGKVQKWIDHSISVTINMPEDISEEMVSEVYKKAHEVGCKGLTVYREGSRSGVLVSNKNEDRPKEIHCDINHLSVNKVNWVVLVGIVNNKPFEVFCLKNKELPKKYTTGKLVKVKSKTYDLTVDDDGTIHNITNEFNNPLEGALTRQISLNLKNSPLEDIYIQLQKEGNVSDFNKVLSRVFKRYLKDKKLKNKCPECGVNLVMESGCVICKNCGHSRC